MATEITTIEQANQIRKEYREADEAYRQAKKDRYTPYAKVSALKAKRDEIEPKVNAALKFLKSQNAL